MMLAPVSPFRCSFVLFFFNLVGEFIFSFVIEFPPSFRTLFFFLNRNKKCWGNLGSSLLCWTEKKHKKNKRKKDVSFQNSFFFFKSRFLFFLFRENRFAVASKRFTRFVVKTERQKIKIKTLKTKQKKERKNKTKTRPAAQWKWKEIREIRIEFSGGYGRFIFYFILISVLFSR